MKRQRLKSSLTFGLLSTIIFLVLEYILNYITVSAMFTSSIKNIIALIIQSLVYFIIMFAFRYFIIKAPTNINKLNS